jgi:hypothetical protein
MYGDACFDSDDPNHRYLLWRCWDPELHHIQFVLCNPSKAGRLIDKKLVTDDTVDRLIDIAIEDGAGGFDLVNLASVVQPDSALLRSKGLMKEANQSFLDQVHFRNNKLVVGWGSKKLLKRYYEPFLERAAGKDLWCVGTNPESGTPMHPRPRGPIRLKLEPYAIERRID